MAAPHLRRDTAEPAHRTDGKVPESLLDWLTTGLGLRGLPDVMRHIAAGLRQDRQDSKVVVSCGDPSASRMFVGTADSDEPREFEITGDIVNSRVIKELLAAGSLQASEWEQVGLVEDADLKASALVPAAAEIHPLLVAASSRLLRAAWQDHLAETDAKQRLEAAKLDALGEFAAGAGHEINNPVATIHGRAQQLLREEQDPERRRALATIGGQALRIRDMIGDCMRFARPPQPDIEDVSLSPLVTEMLRPLQAESRERGIHWNVEVASDITIRADRVQLVVAVAALVKNSLNAVDDGSAIRISASCNSDHARITVADDGCGLSAQDREHLFDPFYSGRQAGRGLGFGLCHCYRIVTMHGGRVEVDSEEAGGCQVTLHWPQL